MPIGRTELAKLADTIRFYINEYTVMAVKLLRLAIERLLEKLSYIGKTPERSIPRKDYLHLQFNCI